ncbi:hypothetical protein J2X69_001817 [Algoriphagus sp. 4150]|uniref:hypothetical protein n=1 Tax=Algoriphagus sp. 4150 TaxID=2817756 RepID=UPI00285973C5|nr:hypothetical protein [Algoriphagus sp. 4150]MDR7129480.1 hypothetical protein [Algoriphagus sp. 4150]
MVERILKIISFSLMVLVPAISMAQNKQDQVRMVVSSTVYISGDLVELQLLTLDDGDKSPTEGDLINLYLVAHDGQTITVERFNPVGGDTGVAFLLPDELPTGNYKLVAQVPGSAFQTEAIIHVFNPTIFSSTSLPKNANPELGLPALTFLTESSIVDLNVQQTTLGVTLKSSQSGILTVKVYDPLLEGPPILGAIKKSEIVVENSGRFELIPVSHDPNSRISVLFLDQGIVEEFNMRDSLEIEPKLIRHRGSSVVWAYQFDNLGRHIGEVPMDLEKWKNNQFSPFENVVPFNDHVVNILDHKRKRKYIDQIYRTTFDNYKSIHQKSSQVDPDQLYVTKDYEGIATLREAFSGIVSKISVKRSKGGYEIRLSPANAGFRYEEGPLILFNGTPIFELGELIETPFHQIKSISIYNSIQSLKRFGVLGRFGVIEVDMKEEFGDPMLAKKAVYPFYQGINDLVQTKEELDPAAPDLRTVLLWGSHEFIEQDQTPSFDWRASDVEAEYVVWIDVLTKDGTSQQWYKPLLTLPK